MLCYYVIIIINVLVLLSALAATTINNQPHVFWFNETDRYIYHHDGNTAGRYFKWHAPDAVIAILGYTKKQCKKSNKKHHEYIWQYSTYVTYYQYSCQPKYRVGDSISRDGPDTPICDRL